MKNGNRQIVLLGESNENNVIVEQGLKEGDVLYLSTPAKPEGFRLTGGNLIAVNRERAKAKREEEERIRQEAAKSRQKMMPQPGGPMNPEMMQNMRGNFQRGQNGRTGNAGPAGNSQNRAGSQQQPGMNPTASQRNLPERPVGPGQNSPAGSRNPN